MMSEQRLQDAYQATCCSG